MRYFKKVSLVICIKLYCLIHLDIPDLEWRNFEWTDTIFLNIKILQTISDIENSRFEIANIFNFAHPCSLAVFLLKYFVPFWCIFFLFVQFSSSFNPVTFSWNFTWFWRIWKCVSWVFIFILRIIFPGHPVDFTPWISPRGFHPMDFIQWISSNGFHPMDFIQWISSNGFHPVDFIPWISSRGFHPVDFIPWISPNGFQSPLNLCISSVSDAVRILLTFASSTVDSQRR